jgi:hypothetical protein
MIIMLLSSEPTGPRGVLLDHEEEGITILQSAGYLIRVDKAQQPTKLDSSNLILFVLDIM